MDHAAKETPLLVSDIIWLQITHNHAAKEMVELMKCMRFILAHSLFIETIKYFTLASHSLQLNEKVAHFRKLVAKPPA